MECLTARHYRSAIKKGNTVLSENLDSVWTKDLNDRRQLRGRVTEWWESQR